MNNISFESISWQAGILLEKHASTFLGNSLIDISGYYFKLYLNYLSACGWTELDFNIESLKRIDLEWERIINPLKFLN